MINNRFVIVLLLSGFLVFPTGCKKNSDQDNFGFQIIGEAVSKPKSPFYFNKGSYPKDRRSLPIGVFDSGTGGLSVLNSILTMDEFNNQSHEAGSDGITDFESESFVYLADEANMPYGKYDGEGKADFLRELVLKDVIFLLQDQYYISPTDDLANGDKLPVKSIVIACNTATAFGLDTVRKAMDYWDLHINISGIIEAGSREAIKVSPRHKSHPPVVGILATQGTCSSGAYPATIEKIRIDVSPNQEIYTVQQAGLGLAGAIDGDINYIDPNAESVRESGDYFGPGLNHPEFPVSRDFWEMYNFNRGNELLIEYDQDGELLVVQLNSVQNYVRYMITHLLMNILLTSHDPSLDVIVLGCTHYSFVEDEIRDHLNYFRKIDPIWEMAISPDLLIIDPAKSLAEELYKSLNEEMLFTSLKKDENMFFISVPNAYLAENDINELNEFPYSWKYGREINSMLEFVKRVPFSDLNIDPDVNIRIKKNLPSTYELIDWK